MRKLNTGDAFKFARIMKSANAKEEIKNIFEKINNSKIKDVSKLQEQAGIELIAFLIEACGNEPVENAVYDFLAGVCEVKPEEIREQSIDRTIEQVKEIVKVNNIADFFNQAVKLA